MSFTLNSWGEEILITGLLEQIKTGDCPELISDELISMRVIEILLVELVRIEVEFDWFE